MKLRVLMAPDQIDKKFSQTGWRLDPHICPACAASPKKDSSMASKPSPAAMKAQLHMLQLLQQHFDADNGRYVTGWSDAQIASVTNLSADTVAEYRRAGFGEIKEPVEIATIRADIAALERLHTENNAALDRQVREGNATFTEEIAALRSRLAKVSNTLGIPA